MRSWKCESGGGDGKDEIERTIDVVERNIETLNAQIDESYVDMNILGESRGIFLTGKWRELLEKHPWDQIDGEVSKGTINDETPKVEIVLSVVGGGTCPRSANGLAKRPPLSRMARGMLPPRDEL